MAGNDDEIIGTFENDEGNEVQDNPQEDVPVEDSENSNVISQDDAVITQQNPKVDFVTNFLYENNGNVYGMEVLIYGRTNEDSDNTTTLIDRLVVVNESEFDSWTTMIGELSGVYVPYTENDLNNLTLIREKKEAYDKGLLPGGWDEYQEFIEDLEWSDLKNIGSLEKILQNNETNFTVDINASTLNGHTSDDFSTRNHNHSYAPINHSNIEGTYGVGNDSVYGHVKVINNLQANEENAGESLSAYQGKVLNDKINNVGSKFSWSALTKKNDYLSFKVNSDLRLIVCYYHRNDYTGYKNKTGKIELHGTNTIPSEYRPKNRVITSLYRGDVTLVFKSDGTVNLYSLTKLSKFNIDAQVMWHY